MSFTNSFCHRAAEASEDVVERERPPSASEIREQLQRIARSRIFLESPRLVALLQFVVDYALGSNSSLVTETIVGNAVYERSPPYDPRIDSVVRVESRRLRLKMSEYYGELGRRDPVVVELPLGGYTPRIFWNHVEHAARAL